MDKADGGGGEALRPRTKRMVTRKEHSRARAQTPATQESLPWPFASQADVFEKYCLDENLKAVLRLVLKFHFRSLKKIRAMEERVAPGVQVVTSSSSIAHLDAMKMQISETINVNQKK